MSHFAQIAAVHIAYPDAFHGHGLHAQHLPYALHQGQAGLHGIVVEPQGKPATLRRQFYLLHLCWKWQAKRPATTRALHVQGAKGNLRHDFWLHETRREQQFFVRKNSAKSRGKDVLQGFVMRRYGDGNLVMLSCTNINALREQPFTDERAHKAVSAVGRLEGAYTAG